MSTGDGLPLPPPRPERLVFLGTPPVAATTLRSLVGAGHEVVLVVTQPDRRRGRGAATSPSAVKLAALELGLPVTHDLDDVVAVSADLGVVVAYGRIIPRRVLAHLPMCNLHFSLLPRWRGAAPVERALLAGDTRTGVAVMAVAEGLDEGGIYAEAELVIDADETAAALTERLGVEGDRLLLELLAHGFGDARPQDGAVTYAAKITPADRCLHWDRPAAELARVVRVGGAWTSWRSERFKVLRARSIDAPRPGTEGADLAGIVGTAGTLVGGDPPKVVTGDGLLELHEVQASGRRPQSGTAWVHGAQLRPGEGFG